MSQTELMRKRTPAQQAKAILLRCGSYEKAKEDIRHHHGNSTLQREAKYWERTLQELRALRPAKTGNEEEDKIRVWHAGRSKQID